MVLVTPATFEDQKKKKCEFNFILTSDWVLLLLCDLSKLDVKTLICESDEHYSTYVKYVEADIIIYILNLESEALYVYKKVR